MPMYARFRLFFAGVLLLLSGPAPGTCLAGNEPKDWRNIAAGYPIPGKAIAISPMS